MMDVFFGFIAWKIYDRNNEKRNKEKNDVRLKLTLEYTFKIHYHDLIIIIIVINLL